MCGSVIGALAAGLLIPRFSTGPRKDLAYEQITNFTESAVAPALSPDGRMIAFIRGDEWFLSTAQIYLKWLPDGEPVQVTHDPRPKFAPTFSPDSSRLAYTIVDASRSAWDTLAISVLGGEPHLLLPNAAGTTWLGNQHLLFSEIKTGMHMAIVTAAENRDGSHDIYVPAHERAMAHFSYASPDRKWVLVVEMDGTAAWQPCRLVPFDGSSPGRPFGPLGPCTSAAWSPDGHWMYFGVAVDGNRHLWRQRFPKGTPEQLTFGPTEEEGIAVAPDGKSLITSIGMHQSAIWVHDSRGDHPISMEGHASNPSFAADGSRIYYLVQRDSPASPSELCVADLKTSTSELILSGFSIDSYDISRDEKEVVFATKTRARHSQIWLASINRTSPPRLIASSGEPLTAGQAAVAHGRNLAPVPAPPAPANISEVDDPHFGPRGEILFRTSERGMNYLFRMNRDGSGRAKVVPYPIASIFSISPDRRWIAALAPLREGEAGIALMAVPTEGGPARRICSGYCVARWAPDGAFLYVTVQRESGSPFGKMAAIAIPAGESLPSLPDSGISSMQQGTEMAAGRVIETEAARGNRGEKDFAPGRDPSVFAYVKRTVHRNLFRISLN